MELPLLDYKCPECNGSGLIYDGTEDPPICGVCDGAQRVPTEAGEAILTFLRRYEEVWR